MRKTLLLLCVCLFGAVNGAKAWTSVTPQNGRWYYLYNIGNNKDYFKGTSTSYSATANIVEATPVKVEESGSNHKLAFLDGNKTYRIYHSKGTGHPDNTSGVDFIFDGSADDYWGYRLQSKNDDKYDRFMTWNGTWLEFRKDDYSNIRDWKFIAYEEVLPSIVKAKASTCASTAEASYVSGWERVTTKAQLLQNPEKYFYAIFSAVNPGVMMTTEYNDSQYRMCYKAAGNPLSSSSYDLFEIEGYDGEIAIKSNITGQYYGNTSGYPWDFVASKATLNVDCKVTATCNDEVFNLQDNWILGSDDFVGNYLGAWDNMEFVGERLAGNKGPKRAGYFLIYRIAKEGLNMTSRIKDPNLDGNLDDWEKESEGGNGIVAANGGAESWNSQSFNFYQTLTNLPNGYYEIGVKAFYRAGDKRTAGTERNVKLYAKSEEVAVKNINQYQEQASSPGTGTWVQPDGQSFYVPDDTQAANYALNTLNAYNNSVVAQVTDGTLTFGVKKSTSIGNDWSYWDTFTLTYLGGASANLKVNDGKLGTFIAPFDITLPDNVKAYSATSDKDKVTLTKIKEGGETLSAGTPVIIYGDGVSVNTTFYGNSTVSENQTVGALTGILKDSDKTISSGKYVLQTKTGTQAFYKLDGDATGALNRCYVSANSVGASARLVISYEDDDPMAINAIEAADAKAEGLKDGKYLVKGKIVLVKNGLKFNANGQILK